MKDFDVESEVRRRQWNSGQAMQWVTFVVVLVVFLAGFAIWLADCADCEARGGAFVRSFWWYSCVEPR